MFQTSNDILNLVLAVSIFAVAVVTVWATIYLIIILKRFNDLSRAIRNTIENISGAVAHLHHKIDSSVSYLPLIVSGISKIVSIFAKKYKASKPGEMDEENEETDETEEEAPKKNTKRKIKVN